MFFTNQTSKAAPPAFTGIALLAIAFGFSLAFTPPLTPAQEPTNLQAATAVQRVLVDVIAQNEKSVVAIARV